MIMEKYAGEIQKEFEADNNELTQTVKVDNADYAAMVQQAFEDKENSIRAETQTYSQQEIKEEVFEEIKIEDQMVNYGLIAGFGGLIQTKVDARNEKMPTKQIIELKEVPSEDSFVAKKNAILGAKPDKEGFMVYPMTDQERKTRDLITLKRSKFEMDEYVKGVQVRNIVQESLMAMMDKLNQSDSIARKNKLALVDQEIKLKSIYQQLISLQKLNQGQNILFKQFKNLEMTSVDLKGMIDATAQRLDTRLDQTKYDNDMIKDKLNQINAFNEIRDQRVDMLQKIIETTQMDFKGSTEELTKDFNIRCDEINEQLLAMPKKIYNAENAIALNTKLMIESQENALKRVLQGCKVDNERISKCESQLRLMQQMSEKVETIDNNVQMLLPLQLHSMETRSFIERTLPTLIHFQLVEGLHVIAEKNIAQLREFERDKLQELQQYQLSNEGRDTYISKLKYRLREFSQEQLEQNLGIAPFIFGKNRDYWPDMDETRTQIDRKGQYLRNRSDLESKKLEDQQNQEEFKIKKFIKITFTDFEKSKQKKKTKKPEQKTEPQMNQNNPLFFGGFSSQFNQNDQIRPETESSKKNPKKKSINILQTQRKKESIQTPKGIKMHSEFEQKKTEVSVIETKKEPENTATSISHFVSEIKTGRQTEKRGESAQNFDEVQESDSDDVSESNEENRETIVNEITNNNYIHNVHVIRKFDMRLLKNMTRTAARFMFEGKKEFGFQLKQWQDLFEETQEDIYELQDSQKLFMTKVEAIEKQFQKITKNPILRDQAIEISSKEINIDQIVNVLSNSRVITGQAPPSFEKQFDSGLLKELESRIVKLELQLEQMIAREYQIGSPLNNTDRMPLTQVKGAQNKISSTPPLRDKDFLRLSMQQVSENQVQILPNHKSIASEVVDQHIRTSLSVPEESIRNSGAQKSLPLNDQSKQKPNIIGENKSLDKKNLNSTIVPSTSSPQKTQAKFQRNPGLAPYFQHKLSIQASTSSNNSNGAIVRQNVHLMKPVVERRVDPKYKTTSYMNQIKQRRDRLKSLSDASSQSLNPQQMQKQDRTAIQMRFGKALNLAQKEDIDTRNTNSRVIMMEYIKNQLKESVDKIKSLVKAIDQKYDGIQNDKQTIIKKTNDFIDEFKLEYKTFIEKTSSELTKKGFEAQNRLEAQMKINEDLIKITTGKVSECTNTIDDMKQKFEAEYQEFLKERKRWKSDFKTASDRAVNNFKTIEGVLTQTLTENATNTAASKMILDAIMIDQLIAKQDIEDRKQIAIMGVKSPQDLLNTHQDHQRYGSPNRVQIKNQTQNFIASRNISEIESQKTLPMKLQGETELATPIIDSSPLIKAKRSKIKNQPVLSIDRNCLSCSGNMNQTIMQFKIACLSYVQQPVLYKAKHYNVAELLKTRANIMTACQKLLRANLKGTTKSVGEAIRNRCDEEAFVIEPLLSVMSIEDQQQQKMEDQLKNTMNKIFHYDSFAQKVKRSSLTQQESEITHQEGQDSLHIEHTELKKADYRLKEPCDFDFDQPSKFINPTLILRDHKDSDNGSIINPQQLNPIFISQNQSREGSQTATEKHRQRQQFFKTGFGSDNYNQAAYLPQRQAIKMPQIKQDSDGCFENKKSRIKKEVSIASTKDSQNNYQIVRASSQLADRTHTYRNNMTQVILATANPSTIKTQTTNYESIKRPFSQVK